MREDIIVGSVLLVKEMLAYALSKIFFKYNDEMSWVSFSTRSIKNVFLCIERKCVGKASKLISFPFQTFAAEQSLIFPPVGMHFSGL